MIQNNKSIAIVGVSSNPEKYGYTIFKDLLQSQYVVYGVNLKGGIILDQQVYPSLSDIPEIPDLVMTVVPPSATNAIVDTCHKVGVQRIWMQPGSESEQAIKKAEGYGIHVTAHQCFMRVEGLWT